MDLTPGQIKALVYWGVIESAVTKRASTADLWDAIREAAAAAGRPSVGVSASDISRLRGIAASQRNTAENLDRARPGDVITSSMIAQDIAARPLQDQILAPSWIVRFEHDVTIDGQLQTFWRSSVIDGSLPPTKGQLRSQIEADASAMADDYGVTHIGVGRMQITAV